MVCAAYFGPFGPTGYPDPTIIQTIPKPDYFFLWLYAMLALMPPQMETPALIIGPVVLIGFLILLPFLSGEGEKSWKRRPAAVVTLLLVAVSLAVFTHLATYSPWSPVMDAWSGEPLPVSYLNGLSPLQRQGVLVFQDKQCHNCHEIGGLGGKRGPDLTRVATRMTHDQLVRQVIQGGGNMPAYAKNLNPAEVTALVSFLETLHPPNQPKARDAAQAAAQAAAPSPGESNR
ncbi:MAG TPA: c-type cytochrome, partial [Candidatus Binatia bacterium]|nr:c-type cytochrome [Candidatus Binatia bacterium]